MTPAQFFDPQLGESLAYPGQEKYRGQCVQSVMLWLAATGTTPPVYLYAHEYYDNGVPGYTKIPAGGAIEDGDLVVYSGALPPSNGDGHIDVATGSGTATNYTGYDQNWNEPLKLTKVVHNGSDDKYILGYLRKNTPAPAPSSGAGTAEAIRPTYVRVAPNTSAALGGTELLQTGNTFEYQAKVQGQEVNQNGVDTNVWYFSTLGHYVWSGNCKDV